MKRPWTVLLAFTGVFLAGAVAGGFVSLRFTRSFVQQRSAPERFETGHLKRLTEMLELSEEQQKRISPIISGTAVELKQIRKTSGQVMREMDKKIAGELTPEQRVKFDDFNKAMRKRYERPPTAPADGPPGEGPPPPR